MIYAEILTENSESKNVFELTYESPILMIEGKTEENSYKFYFLPLLGLVFLPFWRKKKLVQIEAGTTTISEPEKKNIEIFIEKVLGHGSQGTTVFEGLFQERSVAVKRILKNCIKEAKQEVNLLLKADAHPNVVTFFA